MAADVHRAWKESMDTVKSRSRNDVVNALFTIGKL